VKLALFPIALVAVLAAYFLMSEHFLETTAAQLTSLHEPFEPPAFSGPDAAPLILRAATAVGIEAPRWDPLMAGSSASEETMPLLSEIESFSLPLLRQAAGIKNCSPIIDDGFETNAAQRLIILQLNRLIAAIGFYGRAGLVSQRAEAASMLLDVSDLLQPIHLAPVLKLRCRAVRLSAELLPPHSSNALRERFALLGIDLAESWGNFVASERRKAIAPLLAPGQRSETGFLRAWFDDYFRRKQATSLDLFYGDAFHRAQEFAQTAIQSCKGVVSPNDHPSPMRFDNIRIRFSPLYNELADTVFGTVVLCCRIPPEE